MMIASARSGVAGTRPSGSFCLAHENLTYEDLLRIVELIKSSERFSEFRLKVGDIEVELRRRRDERASGIAHAPQPAAPGTASPTAPAPPEPAHSTDGDRQPTSHSWRPESIVIRAPMVGTFYRAPQPGAAPFVTEGQVVEHDTIVCIIEVMKLMNSIPAGARGIVREVLVQDGATVETGAPLIVLDPHFEPE